METTYRHSALYIALSGKVTMREFLKIAASNRDLYVKYDERGPKIVDDSSRYYKRITDEHVEYFTARRRIEQIKESLKNENISYGELAELQSLTKYIDSDEVDLLEAAGVPEFTE